MKRVLWMLLAMVSLFANTLLAQDIEAVKRQIEQAAANVKTMDCDFVQTKHLKMLNEKMESKGKMYYHQPNQLRWEYITPYSYVFILNENKVILKNEYQKDEIDIQNNKVFKEIVRIMMNTVVGKCLSDDKRFKAEVSVSDKEWIAHLIPQAKDMKRMFQEIRIHFNKTEVMVSAIEILEKNGDNTSIEFKNIKLNKPLNDKVFTIRN